jgi:hypothetical protein
MPPFLQTLPPSSKASSRAASGRPRFESSSTGQLSWPH